MKRKKILIIVIIVLTVGLLTGAGFMINEHLSNKDYNPNLASTGKSITVLCLDNNDKPITNTEIRVTGITNQDTVAIFTTNDNGIFKLSNAQPSKAKFGIVTEEISTFTEAKITKSMIKNDETLTITFTDYTA